jgi:hypothetical protein
VFNLGSTLEWSQPLVQHFTCPADGLTTSSNTDRHIQVEAVDFKMRFKRALLHLATVAVLPGHVTTHPGASESVCAGDDDSLRLPVEGTDHVRLPLCLAVRRAWTRVKGFGVESERVSCPMCVVCFARTRLIGKAPREDRGKNWACVEQPRCFILILPESGRSHLTPTSHLARNDTQADLGQKRCGPKTARVSYLNVSCSLHSAISEHNTPNTRFPNHSHPRGAL